MKNFLIGFLLGALLALTTTVFAGENIRLFVDGREILFPEAPPQIINNRVMVPARPLAEALGAEVEWDSKTQSVKVSSKAEFTGVPIGWYSPRTLNTKYPHTRVGCIGENEEYVRFEGNGHYVILPLFGGPDISGVSDTGVTVRGLLVNGRTYVCENDLRTAGII